MTENTKPTSRSRLSSGHDKDATAKISFLKNIFVLAVLITFGMGFVRWQESVTLGLVDFGFCLFSIGMLYLLHNHQEKIGIITAVALSLFLALFYALYLLAPSNPTRISLFFLFLAASFFLQGRRAGLIWLVFIIVALSAGHLLPFITTGFSHIDILTVDMYLIAQFVIYNHYEIYKEEQGKRLQEQEALKLSEERWRLALEGAGDAVWDWDMQSNDLQYSKRFLDMLGYTSNELQNRYEMLLAMVHPDDLQEHQASLATYLASGNGQFVSEYRIQCKDGEWVWVLCRGMVTHRDAQGRPTRMAGTHTDIDEKKKADALIWTQANYDSLTLLPNRRLFRDRLDHEIKRAQRERHVVARCSLTLIISRRLTTRLGTIWVTSCWSMRAGASSIACAKPTRWRAWAATNLR
jgi:PAS domain S-box-containing protein